MLRRKHLQTVKIIDNDGGRGLNRSFAMRMII
jgi:hypothetical protein